MRLLTNAPGGAEPKQQLVAVAARLALDMSEFGVPRVCRVATARTSSKRIADYRDRILAEGMLVAAPAQLTFARAAAVGRGARAEAERAHVRAAHVLFACRQRATRKESCGGPANGGENE